MRPDLNTVVRKPGFDTFLKVQGQYSIQLCKTPSATCLGHLTGVSFRTWTRRHCPNSRLFLGSSGRQSRMGYGAQHHTLGALGGGDMLQEPLEFAAATLSEVLKAGREDLGVASRASPFPFPPAAAQGFPDSRASRSGPRHQPRRRGGSPERSTPRPTFGRASWGAHPAKPARCLCS